jgi:DNA-binding MarR family transcriptional regulator
MRHAAIETQIDAFHSHVASGGSKYQRGRILEHFKAYGGNWSIGELSKGLGMDKSTISARVNELLKTGELIDLPKRRDLISGVLIRPVALPKTQLELI